MGLPLRVHGEPIGYLTVDSTHVGAYGPQDAALVQAFADEVAIAIENARLFQQVQHLAITDPLTGLRNRRYFFEAGRRELERARRYQRPVALLMLDIDHFKRVNDTYGHLAGDRVLVTLAARCAENLRAVDISARYGGEEFVFLLPETGMERANQVADRLRTAIMETPIDTGEKQISISVSLGLAELDEDCADLQGLVARADLALYVAKDTGRARVTVWVKEMGASGA
jgi:diguanylate cyclase (GGDEF)-like protein